MKHVILAVSAALALFAAGCAKPQAPHPQTEVRQQLSDNVRPTRYQLTVTPDAQNLTLQGDVGIDLQVTHPTHELVLHALNLTFASVSFDGQDVPVANVRMQSSDQTAHIALPSEATSGAHKLAIRYSGVINRQAQGMFASDYDAHGHQERMLVTQFEASDARRFLPCFDEPSFRAIFDVTVVAPANRVVISNMPQASSQTIAGGVKQVHFQPTPAMASYLLFVGVGDFERVTTHAGGIEINVWTKRGDAEKGRFALQAAAEVVPYYNDYFGVRYPLPKLDIIAAPGNSAGFAAMENWGAILFFEEYSLVDPSLTSEASRQFIYTSVAHEIAHMWFGDMVTMAWWDDLWLNEGFATWMENKASTHFHPEWNLWMQAQASHQNAMQLDARAATTHPIVVPINNVDEANELFDNITYQKGDAVIHMFETYVGEDAFRDGVRDYIRAHAYGNARTNDLWDAIQAHAGGKPFRQVADDFTRQAGVPLITVATGACTGGHENLTLTQGEFNSMPVTHPAVTWHTPITVAPLNGAAASTLTGDTRSGSLDLASCGPFVVNPGQIAYFRTRYSPAAFTQLASAFATVPAPDQLGLLYDSRALGRAGITNASDVLALAQRTPRNADPLVWTLIAGEIAAIDGLYGDDPRRERFRTFARALLAPVFADIGWRPRHGESDNASLLRARLIGTLSALADPKFEADALAAYRANHIDGSVRAAVLGAVGAAATPAVFDELLTRARATHANLEKQLYYEALANVRDPALAQRVLTVSLDPDVQTAEGPRLVAAVSVSHPALAVDFADQHESEIAARLDSFSAHSFLPSVATASNDQAMLARVRAYIDALPESARRASEARYTQLQERLSTRARRLDEISAWLSAQPH